MHRQTDSHSRASAAAPPASRLKVPKVTPFFWIIKVLTTAMGESISDFLVHHMDPVVAVLLGGVALAIALVVQFAAKQYVPWIYWLAVAMVAVAGTMAADVVHIKFGVPYAASTLFFAALLAVVFVFWFRTEKTLSIHSIYTPRRELFYWATVMVTFALGTAAGDWTAISLGLGYFASGLLFIGLIAIPAAGYAWLRRHEVLAFWFAYILTRPLGASFADWTGKPHIAGGLGIGDGPIGFALAVVIVVLVAYLSVSHRDVDGAAVAGPASISRGD